MLSPLEAALSLALDLCKQSSQSLA